MLLVVARANHLGCLSAAARRPATGPYRANGISSRRLKWTRASIAR